MISSRAFHSVKTATTWEEIWEAGPYYERISELLEDAESYAILVGWQIDSRLPLKRPSRKLPSQKWVSPSSIETLIQKVIRICQEKPGFHFYFLLWDHAYLYVLEREAWQGRIWDNVHDRVHFVFDNRHSWGVSHHEKVCIVDGNTGLCGGIDLCNERWDSPQHLHSDPRRSLDLKKECHGPYHDLAVQITGPICAEIHKHIKGRWEAVSSVSFPDPIREPIRGPVSEPTFPGHLVYLSRTIADTDSKFNKTTTVREVEFLFRDLVRTAKHRIVLEGQYYWSEVFNDLLISKIHQMRGTSFELILILAELEDIKSLTRFMSDYELKLLSKLQIAANYAGIKLVIGSPYSLPASSQSGDRPKPIYIHSKALIIDDQFLSIGSTNFATRAFRVDTEVQLTFEARNSLERMHIRQVADSILKHWSIQTNGFHLSQIFTRAHYPKIERNHLKRNLRWTRQFPCQIFFDPPLPYLFSVKRVYQRYLRRDFRALSLILFQLFVTGFAISSVILYLEPNLRFSSIVSYCGVLSAVWFLPISFSLVTFLAVADFGYRSAAMICIFSFWVAGGIGYCVARTYPSFVFRFCISRDRFLILSKQLGLRKFSHFLEALMDPKVSVHSKILAQGLYFTPLPWFILGMGLIFPAFLYFVISWILSPVIGWLPLFVIQFLRENAGLILILVAAMSVKKSMILKWRVKS